MKKIYTLLISGLLMSSVGTSQINTFNYTGALDSIQIPNCVDSIQIGAWGAQGENAAIGGAGGNGAFATGKLNVTPGDWIYIQVGGQLGYNGGGSGGINGYTDFSGTVDGGYGGSGGGASDVRVGGTALTDRIIVAAGGGGGGHEGVWPTCQPAAPAGYGGEGSGINGGAGSSTSCGCNSNGGLGGNTAVGITPGTGAGTNGPDCGSSGIPGGDGSLGLGGNGYTATFDYGDGGSGGGGGGYYGGGAGGNGWNTTPGGGGGGGSSFVGTLNNTTITGAVRSGDGQVIITFIQSTPIMTNSVGTSGATLTALQSGVSYQWLNCTTGNSVIAGATNQSFTPSVNGSYAVQLNNGSGCIDTSSCHTVSIVGQTEMTLTSLSLYPNPVTDNVQIQLANHYQQVNVIVFDMTGAIVFESNETSSTFELNLTKLTAGSYLLQVIADDAFVATASLIKK